MWEKEFSPEWVYSPSPPAALLELLPTPAGAGIIAADGSAKRALSGETARWREGIRGSR